MSPGVLARGASLDVLECERMRTAVETVPPRLHMRQCLCHVLISLLLLLFLQSICEFSVSAWTGLPFLQWLHPSTVSTNTSEWMPRQRKRDRPSHSTVGVSATAAKVAATPASQRPGGTGAAQGALTSTAVRPGRSPHAPAEVQKEPSAPTVHSAAGPNYYFHERGQTKSSAGVLELGNIAIPKIIHQSWKTKELNGSWKDWSQSWKDCLPDWQYRFYDDDDNRGLIKSNFPEVLDAFDGFSRPVMRADVSRLAYMATSGGLYADLDIECVRDPTELLRKHAANVMMACEGCKTLSNAFFVSDDSKGRAFFHHFVMEMAGRASKVGHHTDILRTTGPWWFSSAVDAWLHVTKDAWMTERDGPKSVRRIPLPRELGTGEIAVLDHKFVLGIHVQDGHWQEWCQKKKKECLKVFNASYTLHHWTHTWMPKKKRHAR